MREVFENLLYFHVVGFAANLRNSLDTVYVCCIFEHKPYYNQLLHGKPKILVTEWILSDEEAYKSDLTEFCAYPCIFILMLVGEYFTRICRKKIDKKIWEQITAMKSISSSQSPLSTCFLFDPKLLVPVYKDVTLISHSKCADTDGPHTGVKRVEISF